MTWNPQKFLKPLLGSSKYLLSLTATFAVIASADLVRTKFFPASAKTGSVEGDGQPPGEVPSGMEGTFRQVASFHPVPPSFSPSTPPGFSPAPEPGDRESSASTPGANPSGAPIGISTPASSQSPRASPGQASEASASDKGTDKGTGTAASTSTGTDANVVPGGGYLPGAGSTTDTSTDTQTGTSTDTSSTTVSCPTNYLDVPANAPFTSADFCVAKYEMKIQGNDVGDQAYNASFVAESRATGTPWVNLTRDQARTQCQALGTGYDLPTNAEWQTLARNIELVPWNWHNGAVGDAGGLSRSLGMSAGIAASSDSDACSGTGHTCDLSTWDAYRRVHQLSTGELIWDVAGNVGEWVATPWPQSADYAGNGVAISQLNADATKLAWSPSGTYTSLNAEPYGGLGEAIGSLSHGSLLRGGAWGPGVMTAFKAGIFSSFVGTTVGDNSTGFRCVYHPTAVVAPPNIFSPEIHPAVTNSNDPASNELGGQFQANVAGYVSAIRFYRGVGDAHGYTVNLWTAGGVNLATATGTDGVLPGWQEIALPAPVAINPNTTYVASYYTAGGLYPYSSSILTSTFSNGFTLTALASGGVYHAGGPGFPSTLFGTSSYFVDVKFVPAN